VVTQQIAHRQGFKMLLALNTSSISCILMILWHLML
jgi:hypothetical protein